jgi:hypothetical protein
MSDEPSAYDARKIVLPGTMALALVVAVVLGYTSVLEHINGLVEEKIAPLAAVVKEHRALKYHLGMTDYVDAKMQAIASSQEKGFGQLREQLSAQNVILIDVRDRLARLEGR